MALTLMLAPVNRWVLPVFFVYESGWYWGVVRSLLADSYVQGAQATAAAMHNAALDRIAGTLAR
ncbi:MAG: hypothetical protein KDB03_20300 [Planctomycetales bacterium]|nr:hypothetical protein [Planctomycetales bacterium]